MGNLAYPDSTFTFFFPDIDYIGVFICDIYLLVEIRLDERDFFLLT